MMSRRKIWKFRNEIFPMKAAHRKQPLHFWVPLFAACWIFFCWNKPWPPVTFLHALQVYVSWFFVVYPFCVQVSQTKARLGLILCVFDKLSSRRNVLHRSTIHTFPFRLPDLHSRHWCVPRLQSRSKLGFWKSSRWPVSRQRLQLYFKRWTWHV